MTEEAPFPELERAGSVVAEHVETPRSAEGRGPLLVLAYLWVFCLVPLAVERQDAEVRWHARHGLVLAVAELIGLLAYGMSFLFLAVAAPRAIPHVALLGPWAALLVVWTHVVLVWEALHGRRFRVPGLSHFADRSERRRG